MTEVEMPAEALATIELIAGAIRRELGEEVDAYPALRDPDDADPLNRAFRAVARSLLAAGGVPGPEMAAAVSHILLRAATRRLEGDGHDAGRVKALVEYEPGPPDDWLAFLLLSSPAQINPLLDPDHA